MPIISPIQSPYLGEVTIGSGSLLIGSVNVPGSLTITNTASNINVINSAGWVVATTASQVGTWRVFLQTSENLIGSMNTIAIGAGQNVNIVNSAGWVTIDSAQLLAGVAAIGSVGVLGTVPVSQSGTWRVILATSENLIGTMNTIAIGAGQNVNIVNSAGWVVFVSNTAGQTTSIINSAGWATSAQLLASVAAVGSVGILGTVPVSQSGTWTVQPGNTVNTSAWLVTAAQSGNWNVSIVNSAGWLVNVANTASNVNIVNSAGWVLTSSSQFLSGVAAIGSVSVLNPLTIINTATNVNVINTAGWVLTSSSQLLSGVAAVGSVSILNPITVINTATNVSIVNSAGWILTASANLVTAGTTRVAAVYHIGGNIVDESAGSRAINRDFANATASGTTQVVGTQGGAIRIRVLAASVISSTATSVKFQGGSTDISATFPTADRGGFVLPYSPHGWFQTGTNLALNLNLADNATTGCQVLWVQAA